VISFIPRIHRGIPLRIQESKRARIDCPFGGYSAAISMGKGNGCSRGAAPIRYHHAMLSYQHAVVTGASSGIGRALALVLARRGAAVTLIARRAPLLVEVETTIRASGGRARSLALDVTDGAALVAALGALDDEAPVDLVVANAGAGMPAGIDPMSWEAIEPSCRVSFLGAAATVTALLPRFVARGHGQVAGVSSLSAVGRGLPRAAGYAGAKAGLSMLLDCLRLDAAPHGVAVTTIHAGFVATAMTAGATHPLPFLWSAERAAVYIADRLPAGPARIDFPWPLAAAARAGAYLPTPLRDRLLRRLRP
jgi:short-subunit dehydrogenase